MMGLRKAWMLNSELAAMARLTKREEFNSDWKSEEERGVGSVSARKRRAVSTRAVWTKGEAMKTGVMVLEWWSYGHLPHQYSITVTSRHRAISIDAVFVMEVAEDLSRFNSRLSRQPRSDTREYERVMLHKRIRNEEVHQIIDVLR